MENQNQTRIIRIPLGKANAYFVTSGRQVLLIDTGEKRKEKKILQALASLGFSPGDIRLIILTHVRISDFVLRIWLRLRRAVFAMGVWLAAPEALVQDRRGDLFSECLEQGGCFQREPSHIGDDRLSGKELCGAGLLLCNLSQTKPDHL